MKKSDIFVMLWLLLPMLTSAQIKISDPKIRRIDGIMAFVVKVENEGTSSVEGRTCLKFYDKDGFELREILGSEIKLAPGGVEAAGGRAVLNEEREKEITNAKLYFAQYGCVSALSKAIGNVLEIAYGPKGIVNVRSTSQNQKNETAASNELEEGAKLFKKDASGNFYYDPTKKLCEKVNGLTQSFADGVATKLSVSASLIELMSVKIDKDGCMTARVDTPKGPLNCSIGSIVKTTGGEYLIHTYRKLPDGTEVQMRGMCINF